MIIDKKTFFVDDTVVEAVLGFLDMSKCDLALNVDTSFETLKRMMKWNQASANTLQRIAEFFVSRGVESELVGRTYKIGIKGHAHLRSDSEFSKIHPPQLLAAAQIFGWPKSAISKWLDIEPNIVNAFLSASKDLKDDDLEKVHRFFRRRRVVFWSDFNRIGIYYEPAFYTAVYDAE